MKFLILGAGQSGRLVAEVTNRIDELDCVGFLDNDTSLHGKEFYGVSVLGGDSLLDTFAGSAPPAGTLYGRVCEFCRSPMSHAQRTSARPGDR